METRVPTGTAIPLNFATGRYVRIQLAEEGFLAFAEIIILGGEKEMCDNGIDDDCDGDIDCADSDCSVVIMNVDNTSNIPSCNVCCDGTIGIQAAGTNLEYSIDGGQTFQDEPLFENLFPGEYDIVVRSKDSGCEDGVKTSLEAPLGTPNACCANGGFESGSFNGWTGGIGEFNLNDGLVIENESINPKNTAPNVPFDNANQLIISPQSNYVDPLVEDLNLFNDGTGTYIARLGNRFDGNGADRLTYCFTVEECNSEFCFNYLTVMQDPLRDHNDDEKPFFQYSFQRNGQEIAGDTIIADIRNSFFQSTRDSLNPIVFTSWTCVCQDLSGFAGEEVCLQLTNADCKKGNHAGYTYVDGLCNDPSDMKPVPLIELFSENFCGDQTVSLDASQSYNFDRYQWELCQINNGVKTNCVTTRGICWWPIAIPF